MTSLQDGHFSRKDTSLDGLLSKADTSLGQTLFFDRDLSTTVSLRWKPLSDGHHSKKDMSLGQTLRPGPSQACLLLEGVDSCTSKTLHSKFYIILYICVYSCSYPWVWVTIHWSCWCEACWCESYRPWRVCLPCSRWICANVSSTVVCLLLLLLL